METRLSCHNCHLTFPDQTRERFRFWVLQTGSPKELPKMSAWRAAGLNYINYSNIAAKLVRQALKPDLRAQATRRDDSHIKFTKWVNGKPETEK
ncbi:protein stunted isoform X2 [Wyeomyia smithii]|uniref:protein stunted isoform X2 n=1 Tax=Wyeomyia smithii TaxID=174621 RepID=UPI002467E4D3|nr:protein stunted isoform X2 [Wyeomyia smithii]XP_055524913.1 protein stunted isoform X2 [Wyeomyia smithii]